MTGFANPLHSVWTFASSLSARNLNSPLLFAMIVTVEEMFLSRSVTVLRERSSGMMIETCACRASQTAEGSSTERVLTSGVGQRGSLSRSISFARITFTETSWTISSPRPPELCKYHHVRLESEQSGASTDGVLDRHRQIRATTFSRRRVFALLRQLERARQTSLDRNE